MVVVELLSPNIQEEDQGQTPCGLNIPSNWEVYETILRVPYYGDTERNYLSKSVKQLRSRALLP
jgi:hypothetical protein